MLYMQNFKNTEKSETELVNLLQEAGLAYQNLNYTLALDLLDRAYEACPLNVVILSNRGLVLKKMHRLNDALISFDAAIQIKLDFAEAYSNRGLVLQEIGLIEEAIISYDAAIFYKKNYAEAYSNKAFSLIHLRRIKDAIMCCKNALQIRPNYPEAFCNLGFAYQEHGNPTLAIKYYDQAIKLNHKLAEAHINKGTTLTEIGEIKDAISSYSVALKLSPNYQFLTSSYLHAKSKICDWTAHEKIIAVLKKQAEEKNIHAIPFVTLSIFDDPNIQQLVAMNYVNTKFPEKNYELFSLDDKNKNKNKIRIGYFSADFREHPVSYLSVELFELHNKNEFEIVAFSLKPSKETKTKLRIKNAFNEYYELYEKSDREIAEFSRKLGIDIAVDLGGHTKDNRVGIFSFKPAPIVVSYLGYLGTIGAKYYDYLIADKTLITEEVKCFYSEKIVYLPNYQVNDSQRKISQENFTLDELGIKEGSFIFCCFNNNYKIQPEIFNCWMNIIKTVENSILLLYAENKWAIENLRFEASLRGVDVSRIKFAQHAPYEDYLARYKLCNLFLDTFPYNAGTTASDALWTGLPVLTLQGKSFQSRMASSLLNSLDMSELITTSQKQYEDLAIELALDHGKYLQIKNKLNKNILTKKLFDIESTTKNIEMAFKKMKNDYFYKNKISDIYIEPN
jgi:protein O-GlcNAc transferase